MVIINTCVVTSSSYQNDGRLVFEHLRPKKILFNGLSQKIVRKKWTDRGGIPPPQEHRFADTATCWAARLRAEPFFVFRFSPIRFPQDLKVFFLGGRSVAVTRPCGFPRLPRLVPQQNEKSVPLKKNKLKLS